MLPDIQPGNTKILYFFNCLLDGMHTKALLTSCYTECLKLAADTGVKSIAFCCLSTGVFRFPQQRAAEIATNTVKQYLDKDSRIKKVVFNVFKDEDLKIYNGLL